MSENEKSSFEPTMPRPRLPYLHKETNRHGLTVWYVRIDRGQRIRIRGEYGSKEFKAAYDAAMASDKSPQERALKGVSLADLIKSYRETSEWSSFSSATKRQRENIFLSILKTAGSEPCADITRRTIQAAMDRRKETPFAANNFLKAMRGLFRWATDQELIENDPTEGVRSASSKTDGFHAWTDEEIDRFEARWPIGTRERLAMAIMLYTGLRRGDASRLGRQHIRRIQRRTESGATENLDLIRIKTEKTGTEIEIPLLPELAEIIKQSPCGDLVFVATQTGAPMVKESFGNWFKDACKAANVPGSAHGLRKAGATRAANNGATEAELEAIFGWRGGKMAAIYTRTANRAKLARGAMSKLGKNET